MTRDDRLARFVAGCYSADSGHVDIAECGVCGHLEWRCTNTNQPKGYSVSQMTNPCGRCVEAFHRAPEVVDWALAAIGKLREELAQKDQP